jgi:hypothetical protein
MFIKVNNSDKYVFINKNKYVYLKHYYEEIMRIKFNKKINSINVIDELKYKLKSFRS